MKKLKHISAVILMITIIMFILTGCTNQGNSNLKEVNWGNVEGYTEYTSKDNVKFSYPSEWSDLGTTTQPLFGEIETGTSVNIVTETIPSNYNLKSYMVAAVANIKTSMSIDGEIEQEDIKLNGREASKIKYSATQNDITMVLEQVCFIDNNTAYILTVGTRAENYEQNKAAFENIISSFQK